jgi:hypothetical protein
MCSLHRAGPLFLRPHSRSLHFHRLAHCMYPTAHTCQRAFEATHGLTNECAPRCPCADGYIGSTSTSTTTRMPVRKSSVWPCEENKRRATVRPLSHAILSRRAPAAQGCSSCPSSSSCCHSRCCSPFFPSSRCRAAATSRKCLRDAPRMLRRFNGAC